MCLLDNPIETIHLANGLDLQIRESGDPRGPAVILLHGVTDSLHCWRPFTDALPRAFRAIAVTQRGHGDSSKPQGDYGSSAFAGDLAALMDALGVRQGHIVAHSMSTWVAQRFARDYPGRIASLTLIGGFVTLARNEAVKDLMATLNAMGETIDPAFARGFQEGTVSTPLTPAYLDMVVEESLKAPAHVWRAVFSAISSERPEYAPISSRTLLIGCTLDAFFTDTDRRELAAAFTGPSEILYDDLGHAPHWEQPRRVAADIAAFITQAS